MYISILPACMSVLQVHVWYGWGPEEGIRSLELELQMVLSPYMGAGNPTTKAVITLSVTGTLGSVPGSRWYRGNQISLLEFLVSLIKQFRNGSKWKLKDSFISF